MFVSSGLLTPTTTPILSASQLGYEEDDSLPPSVEETLLAKHHHYHQLFDFIQKSPQCVSRLSVNQSPLPLPQDQGISPITASTPPLFSSFGLSANSESSASFDLTTAAAVTAAMTPINRTTRSLSNSSCLLHAISDSTGEKVQRLLRLTKRRCLSHAACTLLAQWARGSQQQQQQVQQAPAAGGGGGGFHLLSSMSSTPAELVSTLQQYHEPLERFFLKLLAMTSLVSPESFIQALIYLKRLSLSPSPSPSSHTTNTISSCSSGSSSSARGGSSLVVLDKSNLHMTVLAALVVAVENNTHHLQEGNSSRFSRRRSHTTLVGQLSTHGGCTIAELGAAEQVILAKLHLTSSSVVSPTAVLASTSQDIQIFLQGDLLAASEECNHDVTSGHHCWVSLLCPTIQPYPAAAAAAATPPTIATSMMSPRISSNRISFSSSLSSSLMVERGGAGEGRTRTPSAALSLMTTATSTGATAAAVPLSFTGGEGGGISCGGLVYSPSPMVMSLASLCKTQQQHSPCSGGRTPLRTPLRGDGGQVLLPNGLQMGPDERPLRNEAEENESQHLGSEYDYLR